MFYQSIEKWDAQTLGQIIIVVLKNLIIHKDDNAQFTSVVALDELDSRALTCKQLHKPTNEAIPLKVLSVKRATSPILDL